jgi:DNA-binding SARP family transcriptional activator/tetratricopeptide (TPR) repeat protein
MWFGILGPLLVYDGDVVVEVPAARQRALLAALLLRVGSPVPADMLAEIVWDGMPPPGAQTTLRSHVLRLRRVLGPGAGARVRTRFRAYLVEASPDEVDALRFAQLSREGGNAVRAGDWARASATLGEALALWRGAALADVVSGSLHEEVQDLDALRAQAEEWRIDAALHLGGGSELVPGLRSLAAQHPLRERFHGQLMLALYRCGRQAEALAAYRQARRVLVEELGAEPGPELQRLHQQILDADPALNITGAATPAVAAAPAGPAPRQLPAAVAGFTGRAAELAALTRMLDDARARGPGTVVISAIGGTAGVGKTALALHWAHQVAGQFGGGQLYVNLRGYDPTGTPASPEAAIRGFLDALGVPPARIPPSAEAQAGLYRSLLADKRMLIVADNAGDEQQVRPLLPASPASLVLVTSRSQLSGLVAADGARLVTLDMLSHAEAVQMLTARLGTARAAAEPAAADRIASLCACLPLALAVAAARAAARPGFPLAALAAELADSAGRLDALDAGDPSSSVRAVFSWSYRQLTPDAARMFRLLGIHPGADIAVPAAASLAAIGEADARRLLRELARAHLIAEHVPGRYAFHDLLRAYAAERARQTDSDTARREATGRVLDHYLHTAAGAGRLINPAMEPVALAPPRPGAAAGQPADYPQALAWFEAEHQVLLAALTLATGSGFDSHAWQLPWAMSSLLQARGHWQEDAATQRTALAAATRLGDTAAQALSGRLLATACMHLGDQDQARGHFASSLTLYQRLGNRLGEAKIQLNIGVLARSQGRSADALRHAEQALRLFQAIGDKAGQGEALNCVGWDHGVLGDYQQARVLCRQAVTLCAEAGDRWAEGDAWDSVGYAEHHLGNLAEAAACYRHALSLYREAGARFHEAGALTHLGDTRHAVGEMASAREAWQEALAILEDLQHPNAGQVRAKLASTNRAVTDRLYTRNDHSSRPTPSGS